MIPRDDDIQNLLGIADRRDETEAYASLGKAIRGQGVLLWFDGRETPLRDLVQGYGTTPFGHCDPLVVREATIALSTLDHVAGILSVPLIHLSNSLLIRTTWERGAAYFEPGGASSLSRAIHICCVASGRERVLSLRGSFHGYSCEGRSLSQDFWGSTPGCSRFAKLDPFCEGTEVAHLLRSGEFAAVVIEPIQGANGYRPLPLSWLRHIRDVCSATGTYLVDDEIQVGIGRAGPFLAIDEHRVEPDVVVLGKALGGGAYPLSAVLVRDEINRRLPRYPHSGLGSTFSTNPAACRVALLVVRRIAEMIASGQTRVSSLAWKQALSPLSELEAVLDLRVIGLGIAIEFRTAADATAFRDAALDRDLLTYACGVDRNVIKLLPPLNLSVDMILKIAADVVASGRLSSYHARS